MDTTDVLILCGVVAVIAALFYCAAGGLSERQNNCEWLSDTKIYGGCILDDYDCLCFKEGQGHIIFKMKQIDLMKAELKEVKTCAQ